MCDKDVGDAPEGTIWREQHVTGICSDECWNEFLPPEEPQQNDDPEDVMTPPEMVVRECPGCGHDLKQENYHDELAGYLCPDCGGGDW